MENMLQMLIDDRRRREEEFAEERRRRETEMEARMAEMREQVSTLSRLIESRSSHNDTQGSGATVKDRKINGT